MKKKTTVKGLIILLTFLVVALMSGVFEKQEHKFGGVKLSFTDV